MASYWPLVQNVGKFVAGGFVTYASQKILEKYIYSSDGNCGYKVEENIGSGRNGRVERVYKDNVKYAMKILNNQGTQEEQGKMLQEVGLLLVLDHPNIVHVYATFPYTPGGTNTPAVAFVMEYCEGGDLRKKLEQLKKTGERVSQVNVVLWLSETALALEYLHSPQQKLVHRDVKPSNILLKEDHVKLADFGLCKTIEAELTCTSSGTQLYQAPEVLNDRVFSRKSDMWALGCVAVEMMNTALAFTNLRYTNENTFRKPDIRAGYDGRLQEIALNMLEYDASNRPGADQVVAALRELVA